MDSIVYTIFVILVDYFYCTDQYCILFIFYIYYFTIFNIKNEIKNEIKIITFYNYTQNFRGYCRKNFYKKINIRGKAFISSHNKKSEVCQTKVKY